MDDGSIQEDVDFESVDDFGENSNDAGAALVKIQKLRQELKEAHSKRDEYLDGWQRCKADGVNMRRELGAQAERAHMRGKEVLVEELIPVLDSFDMAVGNEAWESVAESWRSGINHIRNQLLDVLTRHGVERYGKVGESFDHVLHEAVQEVEDVAGEPLSIVKVLRHGYKLADRVVRPAQVVVKKGRG